MTHGGTTIIRPGAVAWGGRPDAQDRGYSSCEAIERSLRAVMRDGEQLPGLLAELTRTQLWVPLPVRRRRPVTDGTAVMLPLVSSDGTDFVPCFTSAARLGTWAELGFEGTAGHRRRAGDARVAPHIVVLAAGLARRLPPGLGMALNPDASPGVPLYPESVSYLARLPPDDGIPVQRIPGGQSRAAGSRPGVLVGHPPTEPATLLRAACDILGTLTAVRSASRAWLSVPGQGEGLIISVTIEDPAREADRSAVVDALRSACASSPLHVPFPVDVTFPGEDLPGEPAEDLIGDWIARNTQPFFTRD